jgi:predicted secreted protein
MATGATPSYKTLLKMGDGATPEVFATIAEVKDIKGPAMKLDTEDATSHDSTDGWKEFIPTLLEGGEVGFEIQFVPTGATHSYVAGLLKLMVDRTLKNYNLVFPDATTWTLPAYVTEFSPENSVKGISTASISLKLTGKPTLA